MVLAFFTGGMPGIGEIGIILLVLIFLFGAKKLPQLARSLGSSLSEFKRGRSEGPSEASEELDQRSGGGSAGIDRAVKAGPES